MEVVELFREALDEDMAQGTAGEVAVDLANHQLLEDRFLYGNFDAKVCIQSWLIKFRTVLMIGTTVQNGESACPFQGELVINTYTHHLKQIVQQCPEYKPGGDPIGAISLCAAAVCRSFNNPHHDY